MTSLRRLLRETSTKERYPKAADKLGKMRCERPKHPAIGKNIHGKILKSGRHRAEASWMNQEIPVQALP
jgi:hypothetical protein